MEEAIIRFIRLVGLGSEEKGICHGSAVLALQAFVLGTEYHQSYIKRLEKIAQLNAESDDEALKRELEVRDEQKLLKHADILAHLQTVKLFHSPDEYLHLSDSMTVLRQSEVAAVASMAQSQLAEKRGGIRLVSSFSLAYTHNDMEVYLTSLQKAMETPLHKETRCGLLLSSHRHSVMLGYDATNSAFPWTIDDAATVTPFLGDQCVEVAKKIREIFIKGNLHGKSLILCTAVYSTGDQLENAKSLIDNWYFHCKEIHRVTAEKAKLVGIGGVTWLFRAAKSGHAQTVGLLLKKAADINAPTSEGQTPLYIAAGNGHIETVKLLLAAGADVNVVTSNRFTPLHFAAEGGYTTIVELLLKAGADANAAANNKLTPLDYAIDGGYTTIVKLLLEKKADTHALTSDGFPPLDMAENECAAMIKLSEKKGDISVQIEDNRTHIPVLLQRLFSFFAATSILALGIALSFYFLSSTPIVLAIVFITAITTAITVKYLPVVIAQGYALMVNSSQESKLENLKKEPVTLCEPATRDLLTFPSYISQTTSTAQTQKREQVCLANSEQDNNRLSM